MSAGIVQDVLRAILIKENSQISVTYKMNPVLWIILDFFICKIGIIVNLNTQGIYLGF